MAVYPGGSPAETGMVLVALGQWVVCMLSALMVGVVDTLHETDKGLVPSGPAWVETQAGLGHMGNCPRWLGTDPAWSMGVVGDGLVVQFSRWDPPVGRRRSPVGPQFPVLCLSAIAATLSRLPFASAACHLARYFRSRWGPHPSRRLRLSQFVGEGFFGGYLAPAQSCVFPV